MCAAAAHGIDRPHMNPYLAIIIGLLVGRYAVDLLTDILNVRHISDTLPPEFEDQYDSESYSKSQRYLRDTTRFGFVASSAGTLIVVAFVLLGGFNLADRVARSLLTGEIAAGLVFGGILLLLARLMNLPFSIYSTFVIEEKYGFNRTTPGTFALDLVKTTLLTALIGAPLFAAILWFFEKTGPNAWLYCWLTVIAIESVLLFVAPILIMPLFNKFTPLADGELKEAIETYAAAQGFHMQGVFTMDGSRRSGKSNAFFTGFGRLKRIVLFDTLIEKHTVPELLCIVAHEMGHYKEHHIPKAIARSIITTGITFYLMSLFIKNAGLFAAFQMEHLSIYGSLVFFGFLYAPIAVLTGIIENAISRKHEYQADAYAAQTTGDAQGMISALKRLSVDNLSNLTPHPMKVFLDYSHPPALKRIHAILERRTCSSPERSTD